MQLFNSKSGSVEGFIPQQPGVVRAYVCGPTVYDRCHIGHARTYVNFDVLKRYMTASGFEFLHAQNFTDVDDKITLRAAGEGLTPLALADKFIEEYFRDMDALNVRRATVYARASDYIPEIVGITEELLRKGVAYRSGNTVFFDVEGAGGFGELVKDVEGAVMDKLERSGKRGPFDFVLWRQAGEREQAWESPLGRGRPGWHTECVAMALTNLGETLDIHWGGKDLIYPHHECEAAIAKALTGKTFVRYWLHNNFVLMTGSKMSKSTGKLVYIRDVLKRHSPDALRLFILSKNYREQIEYSEERLAAAEESLEAIRRGAEAARGGRRGPEMSGCVKEYTGMFFNALDDDLQTGQALALLEVLSREITGGSPRKDFTGAARIYDAAEEILGIRLGGGSAGGAAHERL